MALLFPAGLFMGMAFPLGMKLAARARASADAVALGVNGAASVLASVLSVCIALTWSISTAFWAGCARCYRRWRLGRRFSVAASTPERYTRARILTQHG